MLKSAAIVPAALLFFSCGGVRLTSNGAPARDQLSPAFLLIPSAP